VHHGASSKLLASANKVNSTCGIHSLGEVYASMSVLPVKPMIPAEQGDIISGLYQARRRRSLALRRRRPGFL